MAVAVNRGSPGLIRCCQTSPAELYSLGSKRALGLGPVLDRAQLRVGEHVTDKAAPVPPVVGGVFPWPKSCEQ
jgi:hypothetical protein